MNKNRIQDIVMLVLIVAGLAALLANLIIPNSYLLAAGGLLLVFGMSYFIRKGRKWRQAHPEQAMEQQRQADAITAKIDAEANQKLRIFLMGVPVLAFIAVVADASKHGGRIWPQSPIGFVLAGLFILGMVIAPLLIVWKTRKQS